MAVGSLVAEEVAVVAVAAGRDFATKANLFKYFVI